MCHYSVVPRRTRILTRKLDSCSQFPLIWFFQEKPGYNDLWREASWRKAIMLQSAKEQGNAEGAFPFLKLTFFDSPTWIWWCHLSLERKNLKALDEPHHSFFLLLLLQNLVRSAALDRGSSRQHGVKRGVDQTRSSLSQLYFSWRQDGTRVSPCLE